MTKTTFAASVRKGRLFSGSLLLAGGCLIIVTSALEAQSYSVIHNFIITDGAQPVAGLVQGSDGALYGTTESGGSAFVGSVFKIDASGDLTTLHSFSGSVTGGNFPEAGLVQGNDGYFYGTTADSPDYGGLGTVFRIDASGNFTTLHYFSGPDGVRPRAGLVQGSDGLFYGTNQGGAAGGGTIFKMDASGNVTTLYSFASTPGDNLVAGLIQATDGHFYGTTYEGGNDQVGTVFKIDTLGNLTTLHAFSGSDGAYPAARLVQASDGSFYGTTTGGGDNSVGTVFKVDALGNLTTLHSFANVDGAGPSAALIQASDGNFFGTTGGGGAVGRGTIFKMDPLGNLTTVHSLSTPDGTGPSELLQASDGYFYGTTSSGGSAGFGTIFKSDGTRVFAPAPTPPLGPEFQVNTYTTGAQGPPSVGIDSQGNFVVVWTGVGQDGSNGGVFGQRFDSAGTRRGTEFQVNTAPDQYLASVGVDGAGGFVVAWYGRGQAYSGTDIFARRYDSAGAAQGDPFQVNTSTADSQVKATIAMNVSGEFVVAWRSLNEEGTGGYDVFARSYDSGGAPRGVEFQVNTYTSCAQLDPSVGIDASGNFVVAWESGDIFCSQDGYLGGVYGQRFDHSGSRIGSEFRVNTNTIGDQLGPSVGMDATGNFVVTWSSYQVGSGASIFAQRYDSAGVPRGGELPLHTREGLAAMNPSGEFVVAWGAPDGFGYGIFGQRFTSSVSRIGSEFQFNSYLPGDEEGPTVAMNDSGNVAIAWWDYSGRDGSGPGVFARRAEFHAAQPMIVDAHGTGTTSNRNGVLEAGETVVVEPAWRDTLTAPLTFTGTASNLQGPDGPAYTVSDATADYGTVGVGATADCYGATPAHDCYQMTVSGARPTAHWDITFDETLSSGFMGLTKASTLHVGESFTDVPTSGQFYAFIENLFHNGITEGCGNGSYCPVSPVTRGQMAVFLLKSEHGSAYTPPTCAGIFPDVPCPSPFADWIEQLAAEGVTAGCGGGLYCPDKTVTRRQMAVLLLKAKEGSAYSPPPATGIFGDVPPGSAAADWIEELYNRQITGGCQASPLLYCPDNANTRGQMAVFLVKTFGLQLYGP